MIDVTKNIVKSIISTGRTFTASVKVVGTETTFTDISKIKFQHKFSSNSVVIGEAVSACVEIEIPDCEASLYSRKLEVTIFLNGEPFKLGKFIVEDQPTIDSNGTQKIVAYDALNKTNTVTYVAMGYQTISAFFVGVCSQSRCTPTEKAIAELKAFDSVAFDDTEFNGVDCRTLLGYLAGFLGKNCIVDRDGYICFKGYELIEYNEDYHWYIDIDNLDTLDFPSDNSTVDYIKCTIDNDTVLDFGTGTKGISFVNPLIKRTDDIERIYNDELSPNLSGYCAVSFSQISGDPRLEIGDVIQVQTSKDKFVSVPIMSLEKSFDGGLKNKISSFELKDSFNLSTSEQAKLTQEALKKSNSLTEEREKVLSDFNSTVSSSIGLYKIEIDSGLGDKKYYFSNAKELNDATYIVTMTSDGFAWTNSWNNGNPIWTGGISKEGNAIYNYLNANKISANLITAGKIVSKNGNTVYDLDEGYIRQVGEYEDNSTQTTKITSGEIVNGISTDEKSVQASLQGGRLVASESEDTIKYVLTALGSGLTMLKLEKKELSDGTTIWLPTAQKKFSVDQPLEISNGGTGANTAAGALANILGFTPIQQGGGSGQLSNKVYIGWTGSNLKCQVDVSDLGEIPLTRNIKSLSDTANSCMRMGDIIIQWGYTTVSAVLNTSVASTVYFYTSFGKAPTVMLNVATGAPQTIFTGLSSVSTTSFTFNTYINNYAGDKRIYWFAIGSA